MWNQASLTYLWTQKRPFLMIMKEIGKKIVAFCLIKIINQYENTGGWKQKHIRFANIKRDSLPFYIFQTLRAIRNHLFSAYAKFFLKKLTFITPFLTCAYQGVRNVCFSEHFTYALNEWFPNDVNSRALKSFPYVSSKSFLVE